MPLPPVKYQNKMKLISDNNRPVTCLSFSFTGAYLASGSGCDVAIWDTKSGRMVHCFTGNSSVQSLCWMYHNTVHCGFDDGMFVSLVLDDERKVGWCLSVQRLRP
jgi:WD40 repeat protein